MYKIVITDSFSMSDKMGLLIDIRPISAETVQYWCNKRERPGGIGDE